VRLRVKSERDIGVYREEIVNELTRAAKHALSPHESTARCSEPAEPNPGTSSL
jgi:sRNA-binding carbon storage regulator CsrA